MIGHEYTHVQQALQSPKFYNDPKPSVGRILIEAARS
jgi:hypothetical protein